MNLSWAFPWIVAACAAVGGVVAHVAEGSILIGAAIGLAAGMTPLLLLFLAHALLAAWRADRPPCRCGACQSDEYEFVEMEQAAAGRAYAYRCPSCGRLYRQQGDRFSERAPDGSEIPYMRVSRLGRWQPVAGAAPSAPGGPPR